MSIAEKGTLPTQQEPETINLHPERGGSVQVQNHAGGYVYEVELLHQLQRFIMIGSEGGTYYASQDKVDVENVTCIDNLIAKGKGKEAIQLITEISVARRNVKQNPLLYAYAVIARCNDPETKLIAYQALTKICRIPTHLFMFVKFCEDVSSTGSGWGRCHKRAVGEWYMQYKNKPDQLAEKVTKYKSREGWSHKDVLRLAHPNPKDNSVIGFILRYITKGHQSASEMYIRPGLPVYSADVQRMADLLKMYDDAMACTNVDHLVSMIKEHKLSREHCPSSLLNDKRVWSALLPHMKIEALVRNLGKMTSLGLLAENSEEEEIVLRKIRSINKEQIIEEDMEEEADGVDTSSPSRRNFLHPFKILLAWNTYRTGCGDKGKLRWIPNNRIVDALNQAFYQAFGSVEPTGKKFYLAVDVSGSMSQPVQGTSNITCSMAASVMMMVTARTEKDHIIRGFSDDLVHLDIDPNDDLDVVTKKIEKIPMGGTDCAAPMIDAISKKMRDIDVFVIYTDNETWYGKVHPAEALRQYREFSGKHNAKLIVCGMSANQFSIADREDKLMLDVVGFDSEAPRVISEFAKGMI